MTGRKQKKPHTVLSKPRTIDPNKKKTKKNSKKGEKPRRHGPRLPSSILKELDRRNPNPNSDSDASSDADGIPTDVYEYEEPLPQEESKKNRRYDPVDNFEYELPKDFEDEDISSGDDDDDDGGEDPHGDDDDEDRHLRMLHGITGMPDAAFKGKKQKAAVATGGTDASDAPISIQDLLEPLHGKTDYSKLRKRLHQMEQKPMTLPPPLPEVKQQRIKRKVTNKMLIKDITKWEPQVKRNREAPTIYFQKEEDLGCSTVGTLAAEFKPRTEFEKKMALLVGDSEVAEAHWKDGAKLLELNKISVEDVKDRQSRLAKMRSLLFQHEVKVKRIKKIKSKAYHRVLKKEKLKAVSAEMQMDPEAQKEYAEKQEFKRAEEHMTLKHKNTTKWAKHVIKRGLNIQDEGTRAAITAQLNQHELLKRKMHSMNDSDSSSCDDSSDDDIDEDPRGNNEGLSKTLNRAKEKTIKTVEDEDELPKSGIFALPFMERGLKKRKEAVYKEASLALHEFDSSLRQLEVGNDEESPALDKASGKKVFGANKKKLKRSENSHESETVGKNSDNEDESEVKEHVDVHEIDLSEEIQIGSALRDESENGQDAIYKRFDDIIKNPGPKTTYDVAIFASDSWKKMNGGNAVNECTIKDAAPVNPISILPGQGLKGMDQSCDSESDEEMVDGILSSGAKRDYELPSQADLIHQAFAGDDVEEVFEKDKADVLNEENPEPEKPVLLPGWGQWTHVQEKKGTPSWMIEEHRKAKRKREEELGKRKDAHLPHVVISEKFDKKVGKLYAQSVPYPYTSKELYDATMRVPIGPDYNPAISVGALNRPEVIKKPGIIINPIQYEEVNPHENGDESRRNGRRQKTMKAKSAAGKKTH